MTQGHYSSLIQIYKDRLSQWTTEKELWSQIRKAFVAEAESVLRATAQVEPPFDPVLGLRQRGVKAFRFVDDLAEEARLNPTDQGFTIWLRKEHESGKAVDLTSNPLPARLRTTLGHELGHTFFFDVSVRPPKAFVSYFSPNERHSAADEEWWCMDFARAYLAPFFWLSTHFRSSTALSLRLASDLRSRLAVSWDVLFRRLIWDLKLWQNCVVFLIEPSELKVRGLWKSREFRNWTFSKWFDLVGKRVVSREASKAGGREVAFPMTIRDAGHFELLLYCPPRSKLILGGICPMEDSTLEEFSHPMGS